MKIPFSTSFSGVFTRHPAAPPTAAMLSEIRQAGLNALQARLDGAMEQVHAVQDPVSAVRTNQSAVPCNQANIVKVWIQRQRQKILVPIHATELTVHRAKKGTHAKQAWRYLVGQSPDQFDSYEKFLVQGIDSGLGVYQFVSRKAHYKPDEPGKEEPIIGALLARCQLQPLPVLGGRYQVLRLNRVYERGHVAQAQEDYLHYQLDVLDLSNTPPTPCTVPLTQAGLRFSGAVLGVREIKRARAILHEHIGFLGENKTPDFGNARSIPPPQWLPMIVSHAGIGRNATLVVYYEIYTKIMRGEIHNDAQLDEALFALIVQGRTLRGPKFIHSFEQLAALRETLQDEVSHFHAPQPLRFLDNSPRGSIRLQHIQRRIISDT